MRASLFARTPECVSLTGERNKMNKLIASVLVAAVCFGAAPATFAQGARPDPAVVAAIEQIGKDMGDAMVAVDLDRLNRIFADDWTSIGSSGRVTTKEKFFENFKSGAHRLEAFTLGPMDVQVNGNFAVVHGSVTEKRTDAGKDTSGEFIYMDLLEKRNGRWIVIRSAGAKVR